MDTDHLAEVAASGKAPHVQGREAGAPGREGCGASERARSQRMTALSELAGGIAHNLNSIFTAIIGNCELLALDIEEPNDAVSEELAEIRNAAESATDLVQRILSFGRPLPAESCSVDLNWTIVQSTALLRRLIGHRIEVLPDFERDLGEISADPAQIEQIVVNLAINARDAMPSGGELRIRARNVEVDGRGSCVALSISDTGCGMDEGVRQRALEPFFTTKMSAGGTGLGLASVAKTVAESGGTIEIESEVGQGTTIHILFPRVRSEEALDPRPRSRFKGAQSDRAESLRALGKRADSGCGETALVVDADDQVRELLRWALEDEGLRVVEAVDEAVALQQLARRDGAVDLLVTDLGLPSRTGRALFESLRVAQPDLRVLYLADHPEQRVREEQMLDGDAAMVERPPRRHALARALEKSRTCGMKRAGPTCGVGAGKRAQSRHAEPGQTWDVIPFSSPGQQSVTAQGAGRSKAAEAGTPGEMSSSPRAGSQGAPTPHGGSVGS